MSKLRIPKIPFLDWFKKSGPTGDASAKGKKEDPSSHKGSAKKNIGADRRVTAMEAESLDFSSDTLLVQQWEGVPELTVTEELPPEAVQAPAVLAKEKAKETKQKGTGSKDKRPSKFTVQVDS